MNEEAVEELESSEMVDLARDDLNGIIGGGWNAVISRSPPSGSIRTFFVFVDLPQHIEFRVSEMPHLPKETEIELDISLCHPRNPKKVKRIRGIYHVARCKLKYVSGDPRTAGLSQYLELSSGPTPK